MNPTTTRPKLLVIDDHELFRAGLVELLKLSSNFEVAAAVGGSEEGLRIAREAQPELVLLDVELDGHPVTSTIRRLRRESERSRIIVVTMHASQVLERSTLQAGASAFVSKSSSVRDLVHVMTEVLAGRTERSSLEIPESPLSAREAEVLMHIRHARSNKQIAENLGIAEGTVKRHTGNIYEKLGVSSRMEAVTVAQRLGL